MAHINRRYIDRHWLVFVLRGGLAAVFGFLTLFGALKDLNYTISLLVIFLLLMGIIDATSALYNSTKKRGWVNSVIDALIDVIVAMILLFVAQGSLVTAIVVLAVYTLMSGVIDIFHGFLSTVDPTDRFIRVIAGIFGAVMGFVILNSGGFDDEMMFVRFFGAYLLIVGVASMVYGVHNRAQKVEDTTARREAARKVTSGKKAAGAKKAAGEKKMAGASAKKATKKTAAKKK